MNILYYSILLCLFFSYYAFAQPNPYKIPVDSASATSLADVVLKHSDWLVYLNKQKFSSDKNITVDTHELLFSLSMGQMEIDPKDIVITLNNAKLFFNHDEKIFEVKKNKFLRKNIISSETTSIVDNNMFMAKSLSTLKSDIRPLEDAQSKNAFFVHAKLQKGINTLNISLTNKSQQKNNASFVFEYKPKLIIICIGVSNYKNPEIPNLQYAAKDAQDMIQIIEEANPSFTPYRYLFRNEEATSDTLRKFFRRGSTYHVNKNDRVIVFFSGHGFPSGEQFYFGTYDSKIGQYGVPDELSLLPSSDILDRADSDSEMIVIIDACYSGNVFNSCSTQGFLKKNPDNFIISAAHEKAYETEGNGILTNILKNAIKTKNADFDKDNILTKIELSDYIRKEIKQKTQTMPQIQNPVIEPSNKQIKVVRNSTPFATLK